MCQLLCDYQTHKNLPVRRLCHGGGVWYRKSYSMNSRSSDSDNGANSYHPRFRSALHYAPLLANGTLRQQSNSFVLVSEEINVQKVVNGLPQNKSLSSGSVSKKPVLFFRWEETHQANSNVKSFNQLSPDFDFILMIFLKIPKVSC